MSEGDSFTPSGVVMRLRAASGEDGTWEVGFFVWRLLRCRRGILSHAQERRHEDKRKLRL